MKDCSHSSRILVTGGAGFIGRHVVSRLILAGHPVRVLDDLSSGSLPPDAWRRHGVLFRVGDVRDPRAVQQAMQGTNFVIHLAARASVACGDRDPNLMQQHNVLGSLCVLDAAARLGVRRVVLASSCALYGQSGLATQHEWHPVRPISAYGWSKASAEQLASRFGRERDLDVISLRLFNVYGCGQRIGVIPSLLRSAMRDRPFTIHGDGTQTRDFIHVTDAARALVRSLLLGAEYRGQVFNVGSGFARSINSVVDDVARFFPHRFEVRHESARPFDILASCADTAALRVALGDKQWMPWEGGLLQTIRQTQRTVSIKAA